MDPVTVISSINTTLILIEKLRKRLLGEKDNEASDQRDSLRKLDEQVKANIEMLENQNEILEKQNDILASLGKNCEQVALLAKESRKYSIIALIVAISAFILAVVLPLLVR